YVFLFILSFNMMSAAELTASINYYDITVRVSPQYDSLQIEALMDITSQEKDIEISVGKYFRGAEVRDVRVYSGSEELKYKFNDNIINLPLKDRKTDKLLVTYRICPVKDKDDLYSAFAFNISESDCRINASITRTDNWFPKIKNSSSQRLPPFILSIDVPSHFEVMASGRLDYISEHQGRKIYRWKNYENITDRSLYFFALPCKKIEKIYPGNFSVKLYVPDNSIEKNIDYVADVIYKSYKYFEEHFGETGLKEYKVMAIPAGVTGGYSGLFNSMTVGEEYFTKEINNNDILFPSRNIVHEVSHTWWGNVVAADASTDYWLFEGFAKFSEIIALKSVFDKDVDGESFRRLKMVYMTYYGFDRPLMSDIDERDLQVAVAYFKGAMILKTLEFIMGEEAFFKGMKEYVKTFRGKVATTDDFKSVMQKFSPVDLRNFFKDYVYEKGFGEYSVTVLDSKKKGNYYITGIKIDNKGDKDIYTFIEVKTYLENYTKKVFIAKGSSLFLDVRNTEPSTVKNIIVDPDCIYTVCEANMKGAGGYACFTPGGECKFTGIIKEGFLAKCGMKASMILMEIDDVKVSKMDIVSLNRLFVRPAGSRMKLTLKDGQDIKYIEILY
ncbi:MAG: M1 family aminopeptidase, partial [Candidatus Eremiobacterota bacterium]